MPIGAMTAVPYVMYELSLVPPKPKYVLDLGIGFGFYGAAIRQWLDLGIVFPNKNSEEATVLLGVEVHGNYRNPCWDLYDYVSFMNISDWLDQHAISRLNTAAYHTGPIVSLRNADDPFRYLFDAILLCDVLEHFQKSEGASVVTRLLNMLSPGGKLIITTPGEFLEQGAVHDNKYEQHQSVWTAEELATFAQPTTPCFILQNGECDSFGAKVVTVAYRREQYAGH